MEISELRRSIKELEDSYPKISDYEFVYVYDGECNSLWKGKRSNLSVETKYTTTNSICEFVVDNCAYDSACEAHSSKLDKLYEVAFCRFEEYMGWNNYPSPAAVVVVDWIKNNCICRAQKTHGYSNSLFHRQVLVIAEEYRSLVAKFF